MFTKFICTVAQIFARSWQTFTAQYHCHYAPRTRNEEFSFTNRAEYRPRWPSRRWCTGERLSRLVVARVVRFIKEKNSSTLFAVTRGFNIRIRSRILLLELPRSARVIGRCLHSTSGRRRFRDQFTRLKEPTCPRLTFLLPPPGFTGERLRATASSRERYRERRVNGYKGIREHSGGDNNRRCARLALLLATSVVYILRARARASYMPCGTYALIGKYSIRA